VIGRNHMNWVVHREVTKFAVAPNHVPDGKPVVKFLVHCVKCFCLPTCLFIYFVFVQIINDEDTNWLKAEYSGQIGYVPATYVQYIKPS